MLTTYQTRLLTQAEILGKKYKEIAKITGDGYNVFQILKLSTNETRLHSAFIADLLNPTGIHGQRDVFLKLFLKIFLPKEFEFYSETASVQVEKDIGFINQDYTEGGVIDICLTDKANKQILIENKIYAGDQKNQLVRYSKL